jgi:hypothetical protein
MKALQRPYKYTSRHQIIQRIQHAIERRGYPRIQMLLLVALTGGAGFLASYSLLHAGVETIAWRYGLAVAVAYAFFLLLLWLWLRTRAEDYDGLEDVVAEIVDGIPDRAARPAHGYEGAGGNYGGGGASGRWDGDSASSEPLVELSDMPDVPSAADVADADEIAIPLAILLFVFAIVATVVAASLSIVYSAPVLFAELLVDGVLSATLYRRLRRLDSRHWLHSAVRRTLVPFAITAAVLMVVGWGLSIYAPEARTLADALAGR